MDRPIQLMHIAKTAGSYVNEVFRSALGDAGVVLHAELRIGSGAELAAALDRGVRFVAGHTYAPRWRQMWEGLPAPLTLVTLRDPIDQIASHILWLDHYAAEGMRREYAALSPGLRRLVDLVAATDLGSAGALDRLLTHLPPEGVQMLDNCQARYFLCGGDAPLSRFDALTLDQSAALNRAVAGFDLVIRQDALAEGLGRAAALTGLALEPMSKRVNPALSPRRIDKANPVVRAVLSKRTLLDQWLWRHVSAEAPAAERRAELA